jgi:hypothetical protein
VRHKSNYFCWREERYLFLREIFEIWRSSQYCLKFRFRSQKEHREFPLQKTNILTLFREIIFVFSVDHVTFKYTVWVTSLAHLNFLNFATVTKLCDSYIPPCVAPIFHHSSMQIFLWVDLLYFRHFFQIRSPCSITLESNWYMNWFTYLTCLQHCIWYTGQSDLQTVDKNCLNLF